MNLIRHIAAVVVLMAVVRGAVAQAPPGTAARQEPRPTERVARQGARPSTTDVEAPVADAPSDADRRRAAGLTRQSIALVRQEKWAEAERVIRQALALDPADPVNLYNLACVRARLGRHEEAIQSLEDAAEAGFTDFALIRRDPDLDPLRELPRFKAVVEKKDEWQRRAAEGVVAALRKRFGEDYLYEVDFEQKLIFATNVDEQTLIDLKENLRVQAESLGAELFSHKPDAFVTVVVPSQKDYRKLMRLRNVGGFYHDASKTLIAQRLGEVMRHEFTHALHAGDKAPLGQEHAAWLSEGLGVMYEAAALGAQGALVPSPNNPRYPFAELAARRRSLVPLDRFLAMPLNEFMARPNLTYPQSGALVYYLRERGVLRTFYDGYKAGFDADPTGKAALEAATGQTLAEVESAFVQWLTDRAAEREAMTDPRRGNASFLGVRLAPAEGRAGMEVTALHDGGAAAGLEVGDVILSINGKKVNDFAAIRPAVGAYAPGKEVAVRVKRGGEELDVMLPLPVPAGRAPARGTGAGSGAGSGGVEGAEGRE